MPNPSIVPITQPRVPFINPETGFVSMPWYRFLLSLSQLTSGSEVSLGDLQKGPPALTIDEINILIDKASENLRPSTESTTEQIAELRKQIEALESVIRPELGTMSQIQQANVPWQTFDTTAEGVPPDIGTVAWDGGTTLGIQMTANVLLKVGEAEYIYAKASATLTKGQVCYHTGAVGSSGVTTVAPAPIGLTDPNLIVGIAAESIALNDFGLIQISGDIKGFNTTGSSVGETWADGDSLYYNPAYVGSMTKVKPSAPNQKTYMGEVINAGSGGSGSMHIRITPGSVLGGTDSNVQFSGLANNDLIQYDSVLQYWKNIPAASVVTAPGGSTTQLQYNNAGVLAGAVNLQYDGTNLGIGMAPDGSSLVQIAAGSATKAPLGLTTSSGTLMTVPDDGSVEYDGRAFYATPNASNRGVTVNEHFVARTGTKTMASNTSLQSVFGGGSGALTNGALTVNGSTTYYFECSLNLSSMSATSGNLGFSIVGAGTATFTSAAWHAFGLDATTQTTGAAIGGSFSAAAGATGNISTATTGTAYSAVIKGIFRINAAGTIIPSVQLTTASAAVIGANCWFKCYAVGTNTVVSVGNWS